jgi:hypothetical protein
MGGGNGYHDFEAGLGRKMHSPSAGPLVALSRRQHGDALNDKTFFRVFARWPREVRFFSIEWELIETEAEALAVVKETENAVLVFRNDPDVPRTARLRVIRFDQSHGDEPGHRAASHREGR